MSTIRLIVGLGNPGPEYAATRHNAGAWFTDQAARREHATPRLESKFFGLYARSGELHFVWPQTYMNASGKSVAAVARFYKILPEEILVVHDELDLPPGSARFKKGGGHGGHNGLRDIHSALGTFFTQLYQVVPCLLWVRRLSQFILDTDFVRPCLHAFLTPQCGIRHLTYQSNSLAGFDGILDYWRIGV